MAFYYFDVLSFSAWHTEYVEIVCAKIYAISCLGHLKKMFWLSDNGFKKKGQGS
jgi:hypothetical protein